MIILIIVIITIIVIIIIIVIIVAITIMITEMITMMVGVGGSLRPALTSAPPSPADSTFLMCMCIYI